MYDWQCDCILLSFIGLLLNWDDMWHTGTLDRSKVLEVFCLDKFISSKLSNLSLGDSGECAGEAASPWSAFTSILLR